MKYKLVAIDCDNTLLDSKGFIPQENISTIRKLKDMGVQFVIATGRNDILVKDYIKELDISAPVIGCNGASIRDLISNKIYALNAINKDSLNKVFKFLNDNNIQCKAFSLTKGYTNIDEDSGQNFGLILNTYTKALKENMVYEYVKNIETLSDIGDDILKIVIIDTDAEFIKYTQKQLQKIENLEVVLSDTLCIDIIAENASKGNALKQYAEYINIDKEHIIAIGDYENDISMIKYAGVGVAMENGAESLKRAADFVTCSNNDSGVSKALIKLFDL